MDAVSPAAERLGKFTAACSGEQLFCLVDSGFTPIHLVFGNDAYSRGMDGFIASAIGTTLMSGEVPAISDVFNAARRQALSRLRQEAYDNYGNYVSGVQM